jgi:hypothetical protein
VERYAGTNRRIGLIGPEVREEREESTFNSLTRACSSCNKIVLLSGVKLRSYVPEISMTRYIEYQMQV